MRQALTTLFCALLFTIILAIPARSEHPFSTRYVCTTMPAAMQTVTFIELGQQEILRDWAQTNPEFKCYFVPPGFAFFAQELVAEYREEGVHKGVVRAEAPDGRMVYAFGPIMFLNKLLHEEGV